MIPITEFQRRSLSGPPIIKRQRFLLGFARKIREIVAKYEIKYNPEVILGDDAMADRVFQAGKELLVEVGLYHTETRRVVQFTPDEIDQIVQDTWDGPRQVVFGR